MDDFSNNCWVEYEGILIFSFCERSELINFPVDLTEQFLKFNFSICGGDGGYLRYLSDTNYGWVSLIYKNPRK